MKIKLTNIEEPKKFNPISLEIIIETQEEAQSLFELANWGVAVADFVAAKPNAKCNSKTLYHYFDKVYDLLEGSKCK